MSARLKLKKANDRIRGAEMRADRCEAERDYVLREVMENLRTLGVTYSISLLDMVHATGHYIQYTSERIAYEISQKFCEHLAEYIRLNLNLSDVGAPPYNQIKVEVTVPNLNPSNVRITGERNTNQFHDWRSNLVALGRRTLGPHIIKEMDT